MTSVSPFVSGKEITPESISREIGQRQGWIKARECYLKGSILRIRGSTRSVTDIKSGKIRTEEYPLDSQPSGL